VGHFDGVAHAQAISDRVETTRRAWAAGDVTTEQAVVSAEAVNRLGCDVEQTASLTAEVHLIALAPHYSHEDFRHLAAHLVEVVDPDGADAQLGALLQADGKRALEATVFRAHRGVDGVGSFSGKLPRHGFANASIVITITLDQLHNGLGETVLDTGTTISTSQARGWRVTRT